MKFIER